MPYVRHKFQVGMRVKGNDISRSLRGKLGTVLAYLMGAGYLVRFDDGREEYVATSWLDAA